MSTAVDVTTRRAATAVVTEVTTDQAHISEAFDAAFRELAQYLREEGIAACGPGFAVYHEIAADRPWKATIGVPVLDPGPGTEAIRPGALPGGKVAVIVHEGPYEGLADRWSELTEWLRTHDLSPAGSPWESYVVEDSTEPEPSRWRTEIVWPVN